MHEANYAGIIAHFNLFRFIAAKPRAAQQQENAPGGELSSNGQEYSSFTSMFKRQYVRFLKSKKTKDITEIGNVLGNFDQIRSTIEH